MELELQSAPTPVVRRTRRRLRWRRLLALLFLVALAAAALSPRGAGALLTGPGGVLRRLAGNTLGSLVFGGGVRNILLIGNNARNATGPLSLGTAGGQADVLMIVHIDPARRQVVLISIPRNVLVAFPRWRDPIPKIKGAFFLGAQEHPSQGPQLAMTAVSRLTGIPLHHYVVADFRGFEDAINAVGGVRVDVPGRIYDPLHSHANFYAGWQTMNGKQALEWIRVRQNEAGNGYRVNDFQRMQAQAQLLQALKAKLLNPAVDVHHLLPLLDTWKRDVASNLSPLQLTRLAVQGRGYRVVHLTLGSIRDSMLLASAPLPGANATNFITGSYYDVLNPTHIHAELAPYGSTGSSTGVPPLPSPGQVPVQVDGSASYAHLLRSAGFPVRWRPGAASALTVLYPPGHMPWGWAVARAIGAGNEVVAPGSAGLRDVLVEAP